MILLLGGSGLVGREALTLLNARHQPTRAAFRRKPTSTFSSDIEIVEDPQWANPESLAGLMRGVDSVLCAVGTTIAQAGSEAAFRAVDFEIVDRAAREARRSRVQCFVLVSAVGADANSRIFYNRVKGEAEASVIAQNFPQTTILRPSLLLGDRSHQPDRPGERIGQVLAPAIGWMMRGSWARYRPIEGRNVACAMIASLDRRPQPTDSPVELLEGQSLLLRAQSVELILN